MKATARLERKVKLTAKKWGPLAAPVLEALAPIAVILGAAAAADSQFNNARRREIDSVAKQYSYTADAINQLPPSAQYAAARQKNLTALARWLGRELERINDKYDKRPISERVGGFE